MIDHKFPVSGHSFMDSDRDFAHIEKMVKAAGNLYSVDQYQNIMAQSQHKCKPKVTRMQDNLFDIKSLPKALGLTNRTRTINGEAVRFRDGIRWIRVTTFGYYMYRESLDDDEIWKTVDLRTTSSVSDVISISETCQKITGHIKLVKLRDIQKQLPYIPETYRQFYSHLTATESPGHSSSTESEIGRAHV
jgi:hypothetical protein